METLKSKVQYILSVNEASRNSDKLLTMELWKYFYPQYIKKVTSGEPAIILYDLFNLPTQSNITRYRAYWQNKKGLWLPTREEIAKKRHMNIENWQKSLGYFKSIKESDEN